MTVTIILSVCLAATLAAAYILYRLLVHERDKYITADKRASALSDILTQTNEKYATLYRKASIYEVALRDDTDPCCVEVADDAVRVVRHHITGATCVIRSYDYDINDPDDVEYATSFAEELRDYLNTDHHITIKNENHQK